MKNESQKDRQVTVIGLWHLGSVTAAVLAEAGFLVTGLDIAPERIAELSAGHAPLFEPGLDKLLRRNLEGGRLRFTTNIGTAMSGASYVLLTLDTPVSSFDEAETKIAFEAVRGIAPYLERNAVVIINSQVPVGTCEQLEEILRAANPKRSFGLACVPENLRSGRALHRFRHPAMTVIGAAREEVWERVEALYSFAPGTRVRMDLRSAEMTWHAINAYLATCVSFVGEIAKLCDELGADAAKVYAALRLDERVSPLAPLLPGGLGFAGGTLSRELKTLKSVGLRLGYSPHLVDPALQDIVEQKLRVRRCLRQHYESSSGLTIALLGLTARYGTNSLRCSAALEIARDLRAGGAHVKGYDPAIQPADYTGEELALCTRPEEVALDCDALVLTTERPEFKELDYGVLAGRMKHRVMIDTRNLLDPVRLREAGFAYSGGMLDANTKPVSVAGKTDALQ